MSDTDREQLRSAPYVSLATFRKSGVPVPTPVWAAPDGDALYVFSAGGAGKVKRLKRSSRAQVARCDVRGKLLGDWFEAEACLVTDAEEIGRALAALRAKYGWQMVLADLGSRLTGKFDKRAYIRIQFSGTN
ncbi:MAG: PPOX class F420-dependent oxidoreductase [Pseudomonadota bacterium]